MGIRHLSAAGAVLLAVAVAGCGSTTTTGTTTENKQAIAFESPVVNSKGFIPASFRCNTHKVWLPVRWGAIPAGTKELVIYVARFAVPQRTAAGTARAALLAQELIIGLKPTLHGLAVGKLPHGALIGTYEIGKKRASVCPAKGSAQGVIFGLYALNHRQEITKGSQSGGLLSKLRSEAVAAGTFTAGYS